MREHQIANVKRVAYVTLKLHSVFSAQTSSIISPVDLGNREGKLNLFTTNRAKKENHETTVHSGCIGPKNLTFSW